MVLPGGNEARGMKTFKGLSNTVNCCHNYPIYLIQNCSQLIIQSSTGPSPSPQRHRITAQWGRTRFFWISGLAKEKLRVLYTKDSAKLPHLTIWNKKLKNLLLWGTGLIWSKFSFCSRKNNPIQPCEIHIFFPFIFGGKIFLMGPYYLRAPLCTGRLETVLLRFSGYFWKGTILKLTHSYVTMFTSTINIQVWSYECASALEVLSKVRVSKLS